MPARERLVEEQRRRPDVSRRRGCRAVQPFRCDVRERARHVADRGVASAAVVACEPDGPRAAAPEGTDWPVPTEEESLFEACCSGFGHVLHPYAATGQSPFRADGPVTVTLAVGLRL